MITVNKNISTTKVDGHRYVYLSIENGILKIRNLANETLQIDFKAIRKLLSDDQNNGIIMMNNSFASEFLEDMVKYSWQLGGAFFESNFDWIYAKELSINEIEKRLNNQKKVVFIPVNHNTCSRCCGTGYVVFKHVHNGVCFNCDGAGFVKMKQTS